MWRLLSVPVDARPTDEFRWWFVWAVIVAVLGATSVRILIYFSPLALSPVIFHIIFFGLAAAGESFVQFESARRRLVWVLAGLLIGVGFAFVDTNRAPISPLIFVVPAGIESIAARGKRNRWWIWMMVTPLILGNIGEWAGYVYAASKAVLDFAQQLMGKSAPDQIIPGLAANYAALYLARAVVGSFIATRKTSNPSGAQQSLTETE
jgi:hypothetical protein